MTTPPKPIRIGQYLDAVFPSFALLAGMQLDLFTALQDGAMSAQAIAEKLNVHEDKLSPLLFALVAADLLTLEGDLFANTDEANFYLVRGKPAYLGDIHHIISGMWSALPFTAETIRTGTPQAKIEYDVDELEPEEMSIFAGMHKLSLMSVRELLKLFDFSHHRHVADIGGGSGGLAIGLTSALPDLEVTILDLPAVMPIAKAQLASAPNRKRIHFVSGNVVEQPISGTYDGALMRAFTQVLSPQQIQSALNHTYDALTSGGVLYIIAQMLDDSRITPPTSATFNLVFLNVYDEGRAFTESEYRTWLTEAGFNDIERHAPPRGESIIRAVRP
ncbi:MAG: methyltransferase [Aggregatilineales bacterium]